MGDYARKIYKHSRVSLKPTVTSSLPDINLKSRNSLVGQAKSAANLPRQPPKNTSTSPDRIEQSAAQHSGGISSEKKGRESNQKPSKQSNADNTPKGGFVRSVNGNQVYIRIKEKVMKDESVNTMKPIQIGSYDI